MNRIPKTLSALIYLSAAAVGLVMAATTARAQNAGISVHDAWVREPLANSAETAAFVVVENGTASKLAIVGVSTDAASKAELHEMKLVDSMMRMSPVKQIEIPAHGKVELKPGGFHVMLFDLKSRPMAGETMNLSFRFDDGTTVSVPAQVRKVEGMK